MNPEDINVNAQVPDELIAPGALEQEGAAPEGTPAGEPRVLTEEERAAVAAEWLRQNPPQQAVQQPPAAPQYRQPESDELPEDATVADLIRHEVTRAVKAAVEPMSAQLGELIPAQADVSRAHVVQSIVSEYGLDANEARELTLFAQNIKSPASLARALSDPDVRKTLAAQAKGMASFSKPPAPAPATRPGGGIKFAHGVTEDAVRRYMAFKGIDKLGKAEIAELTESGHIVRG